MGLVELDEDRLVTEPGVWGSIRFLVFALSLRTSFKNDPAIWQQQQRGSRLLHGQSLLKI
jgi:hypothetical protein